VKIGASIITINFNSMARIQVILACFKSMLELRWRPLQLIYVDNGSSDGSFEVIQRFANSIPHGDIDLIFLPLGSNAGFAGGNNRGFSAMSQSSKYVVILNNDLSPSPNSLACLIEFLESDTRLAGAQPIIMNWTNSRIDSAGGILSYWGASAAGSGLDISLVKQSYFVSHVYGAYSVYRINAIKRAGGLFLPQFFMYGDDYELGVRLWANGYKLALLPVNGGTHYVSATTKRYNWVSYFASRNETAVLVMYSGLVSFLVLMRALGLVTYSIVTKRPSATRSFLDGVRFGLKLRSNLPKALRHAILFVPKPEFSFVDWALMHTRLRTSNLVQRNILRKMANVSHVKVDK
jgi:N-acetylglucosaminyl-diphospho-decaprenol L-rhamnosyltransferase